MSGKYARENEGTMTGTLIYEAGNKTEMFGMLL